MGKYSFIPFWDYLALKLKFPWYSHDISMSHILSGVIKLNVACWKVNCPIKHFPFTLAFSYENHPKPGMFYIFLRTPDIFRENPSISLGVHGPQCLWHRHGPCGPGHAQQPAGVFELGSCGGASEGLSLLTIFLGFSGASLLYINLVGFSDHNY